MKTPILWNARTSIFLYIYHYLFLAAVAAGLYHFHPKWAVVPLLALVGLAVDARSMRHQLTDTEIRLSEGFLNEELTTVKLEDVVGFQVVDRPPWNWISLGTVIVITDINSDLHPCIKAVRNPGKVAELMKELAVKRGATIQWWGT